jgi:hypothetical protein
MKPEAQRKAIIKFCGWKDISDSCRYRLMTLAVIRDERMFNVHDPLTDLNAMREAERMLSVKQAKLYVELLGEIVLDNGGCYFNKNKYMAFVALNSTAAQRAEAFLKALGLWTED